MMIELTKVGLEVKRQVPITVYYVGEEVGNYFADLVINNVVIIELKVGGLIEEHEAQLINYLKATEMEVGLLLSFGKEAQVKRKVFSNKYKVI